MPTYLYECPVHGEFEEFHSIKITLETCPKCQEEGKDPQQLKRLICSATPGKVELTGQELTDHIKADAKRIQREASKNEKMYANLIGDGRMEQIQTQMDKRKRR